VYQKIGNLEKLLKNLGNEDFVDETQKSGRPSYLIKDSKMSINPLRYSVSPRKSATFSIEKKPKEVLRVSNFIRNSLIIYILI
jgi:hypothetical protein